MLEKIKSVIGVAKYCTQASVSLPECDQFWLFTVTAAAVVVAMVLVIGITIFLRRRSRANRAKALWDAEMRRQDEIAPELRMQHVAWKGDASTEQDEQAVAAQIRQALQDRKLNGKR